MIVAVSACLLGVPCRYDGAAKPCQMVREFLERGEHTVVKVCPEVMGGLSIPHPPSEVRMVNGRRLVVDCEGADNTAAFEAGARRALEKAQRAGCTHAILKAKSPSCGVGQIYDGTFTGALVPGNGVAAELFLEAGICVATEKNFLQVFGLA